MIMIQSVKVKLLFLLFFGFRFCEFQASHFASQIVCLFVIFFLPSSILLLLLILLPMESFKKKILVFSLWLFFLASLKQIILMLFWCTCSLLSIPVFILFVVHNSRRRRRRRRRKKKKTKTTAKKERDKNRKNRNKDKNWKKGKKNCFGSRCSRWRLLWLLPACFCLLLPALVQFSNLPLLIPLQMRSLFSSLFVCFSFLSGQEWDIWSLSLSVSVSTLSICLSSIARASLKICCCCYSLRLLFFPLLFWSLCFFVCLCLCSSSAIFLSYDRACCCCYLCS